MATKVGKRLTGKADPDREDRAPGQGLCPPTPTSSKPCPQPALWFLCCPLSGGNGSAELMGALPRALLIPLTLGICFSWTQNQTGMRHRRGSAGSEAHHLPGELVS